MELADAIHQARELQIQERPDEALQLLLAAAEEHDDEDLWFEIAAFYADRGMRRPDVLALADFAEADKWAELPLASAGRAAVLVRREDFGAAEALTTQALELDPELPAAYLALGLLRLRQGQNGKAIEVLAKAIDLQPRYGEAYALLAEALIADGKKEFAQKVMADAAKMCPLDDKFLVALSRSYVAEEEFAKATRALEQATIHNRENADAWRGLAWLAARDGDEPRIQEALDRAAALDRDATLAWIAQESVKLPALNAFVK